MANTTFMERFDAMVRSRTSLIILETAEEARAVEAIGSVCQRASWSLVTFDTAEGFNGLPGSGQTAPAPKDPLSMLDQIEQSPVNGVYVLKDFHECWANPQIKRKLRNLAQRLKYVRKTLVVTCPTVKLPEELQDEAAVLALPLPGVDELAQVLDNLLRHPEVKADLSEASRAKLLEAALGLTTSQAERAFARAIIDGGVVDERASGKVFQEKKRLIAQSKALQFYDVTETSAEVGGLEALKKWIQQRNRAFSHEAREFGIAAPKGILLIGIPGTGKSLSAKMIASLWQMPLVRFDVGSLFGSLLGESETNVRHALQSAEASAPCILWIDELEKAMSRGGLDGGTSDRVFGSILTWMAEKTAACFLVATANDISRLPPELVRKGRFDDIFFLDLPTPAERKEIFALHLQKRGRQVKMFNLDQLVQASQGCVGSEIEQAVVDSLVVAFHEGARKLTTQDMLQALGRQKPLSVSQRERIQELRKWVQEGRARSASFEEAGQAQEHFVPIEFRST